MKNRLISSIKPEAALESEQYQAGVIEGFHWAANALAKGIELPKPNRELIIGTCPEDTEWCHGWLAGYEVRRNRR